MSEPRQSVKIANFGHRHALDMRIGRKASDVLIVDDPDGRKADRARAAWERKTPGPFITTDGMVLDVATWRPATFEEMHPRYVCAVRPRKPKRNPDDLPSVMDDFARKGVLFLYPYTPAGPRGRLNLRDNAERIAGARQAENPLMSRKPMQWLWRKDQRAARVVRMARKKRRGYA